MRTRARARQGMGRPGLIRRQRAEPAARASACHPDAYLRCRPGFPLRPAAPATCLSGCPRPDVADGSSRRADAGGSRRPHRSHRTGYCCGSPRRPHRSNRTGYCCGSPRSRLVAGARPGRGAISHPHRPGRRRPPIGLSDPSGPPSLSGTGGARCRAGASSSHRLGRHRGPAGSRRASRGACRIAASRCLGNRPAASGAGCVGRRLTPRGRRRTMPQLAGLSGGGRKHEPHEEYARGQDHTADKECLHSAPSCAMLLRCA